MGLPGVFWAKLLALVPITVAAIFVMRKWLSPKYFSTARLREMLPFGLPHVPAALAAWVVQSSDRWVIESFRPMAEVGLYSVAVSLAGGVALFTGAFEMAFGPFAFSIFKQPDSGKVFGKIFDLYVWAGCTCSVGLALLAPYILRVFTTHAYAGAAPCVPFLAFTVVFGSALTIASIGTQIVKKSMPVANSVFINSALNLLLNLAIVPRFGIVGAAFASMAAFLISAVYLFAYSQRAYHIPYRFGAAVLCFVLSWVLIGAGSLLDDTSALGFFERLGVGLALLPAGVALGFVRLEQLAELGNRFLRRGALTPNA